MRKRSKVTKSESADIKVERQPDFDITRSRGWLNPTKCTLRWLGLQPNRLQHGAKTHSIKIDDQAA